MQDEEAVMRLSGRDADLLELAGMTEEQVEFAAEWAEDEDRPDPLTGRVYDGLHLDVSRKGRGAVSGRAGCEV